MTIGFAEPPEPDDAHWPSFRGVQAGGISHGAPAPTRWDLEKPTNVKWKTVIPGLGHSSPVIWGDRVFVTTAVSSNAKDELKVGLYGDIEPVKDESSYEWKVYCLNKKTGEILWEKVAHKGVPRIPRHPKSTHANSTPATDGQKLVAFFGSEGLYCYDLDGKLLWKKDLGVLRSAFFRVPEALWGFASSPAIHEGRVIVQCDVLGDSFLAAFDLESGKEIWRTRRDDYPTWSTPTIHSENGRTQVIVNGFRQMGGYDFLTGKALWRLADEGGDIPVPTPVVSSGLVFLTNAHGRLAPIYAIPLSSSGEVQPTSGVAGEPAVAWSIRERSGAYMQTPIVVDGLLYVCRDNGVLSCFRAATGERLYQERLGQGGGFSASVVSASGKLYYSSEDGDVYVLKAGPKFEVLAVNSLGETCMATPAISEGALYFRTREHLVAIAE
jgi:outer membrane protein assembly factor BamB